VYKHLFQRWSITENMEIYRPERRGQTILQ
jgi:hypothetical protein